MGSVRFSTARAVANLLPPVVAHKVTLAIYPYRLGKRDHSRFEVRARTGSVFEGETSEYHAHHFGIHGYFDWKLWAVARAACTPGDTIVEVGANIGTETVAFADIVGPQGRVVAFEPFPPNVEVLRRVIARSGARNVAVEPVAVSDATGELAFVPPEDEGMTGVGHLAMDGREADRAIRVPVVTLDDRLLDGPAVAMVAIDVEGAEPGVLRGGRRLLERDGPVIVIEAQEQALSRSGSSLAALATQLSDLGFELARIGRIGLDPLDVSPRARPTNWCCWPRSRPELRARIDRSIRRSGLLPPLRFLNPLCG